ncbi:hypothetical protein PPERSA_06417 [Pseudocohnilembus persalinus]|uniref:Uncharacterized protein n=1 Tax=Pseudocohnilembus persalinus TaxID=266149 RepID=A0A0V0QR83_PSEPJ|nr:hypothetical protein PPERSA_06417 [Pseudocohnilembus persalinus]|eukprot:KRX04783.1 hypothetical protein PPERSA_06417 [Pseudocohnilembus persalinus]
MEKQDLTPEKKKALIQQIDDMYDHGIKISNSCNNNQLHQQLSLQSYGSTPSQLSKIFGSQSQSGFFGISDFKVAKQIGQNKSNVSQPAGKKNQQDTQNISFLSDASLKSVQSIQYVDGQQKSIIRIEEKQENKQCETDQINQGKRSTQLDLLQIQKSDSKQNQMDQSFNFAQSSDEEDVKNNQKKKKKKNHSNNNLMNLSKKEAYMMISGNIQSKRFSTNLNPALKKPLLGKTSRKSHQTISSIAESDMSQFLYEQDDSAEIQSKQIIENFPKKSRKSKDKKQTISTKSFKNWVALQPNVREQQRQKTMFLGIQSQNQIQSSNGLQNNQQYSLASNRINSCITNSNRNDKKNKEASKFNGNVNSNIKHFFNNQTLSQSRKQSSEMIFNNRKFSCANDINKNQQMSQKNGKEQKNHSYLIQKTSQQQYLDLDHNKHDYNNDQIFFNQNNKENLQQINNDLQNNEQLVYDNPNTPDMKREILKINLISPKNSVKNSLMQKKSSTEVKNKTNTLKSDRSGFKQQISDEYMLYQQHSHRNMNTKIQSKNVQQSLDYSQNKQYKLEQQNNTLPQIKKSNLDQNLQND